MNTLKSTDITEYAEKINYTSLINCYLKEFTNWSRYLGIPKYDEGIAAYLKKTPTNLHIRIDFSSIDVTCMFLLLIFQKAKASF
jgi:uncharacterized membrane protein